MTKGIFVIPLVIYPYKVIVSYGQTDKEIRNSLLELNVDEKSIKDVTSYHISTYNGICTYPDSKLQIIIRIQKGMDKITEFGTIVHEVTHATFFMFKDLGAKLSSSSDEFYCYMNQYLVMEIMKSLQ